MPVVSAGTYNLSGLAWMAKSMKDFLIHIIFKLSFTKHIECDSDKSNQNGDEEKREDNKDHNVEYALFCPIPWNWALVFIGRGHGILQDSVNQQI